MRKIILLFISLFILLSLGACSKENIDEEVIDNEKDYIEKEEVSTAVFEGIVEEKKDFMIIVREIDGDEAYLFNFSNDFKTNAVCNDRVKVTYSGDINDIDAQLIALNIEIIK